MRKLSLIFVFAFSGAVAAAQSTATLECFTDTQSCTTACITAGETADPVLDCRRSCGQLNSERSQYCFQRFSKENLSTEEKKRIYDQEEDACDRTECKPAFNQELTACTQAGMAPADKDRVVACTTQAMNHSMSCTRSCLNRARQKAYGR